MNTDRFVNYLYMCRFLVDVVNETPINIQGSGGGSNYPVSNEPAKAESVANDLPPPRAMNSKFKVPVSSSSALPPPRLVTRPGGSRQPSGRAGVARPQQQRYNSNMVDFDRNPTSEWSYEPNAINRSGTLPCMWLIIAIYGNFN